MLGVRAPAPSAGRSSWRGSRRPAHGGEGRQSEFAPPASGWEREEDINRCSEPGLEIGGARAAKCVFGQRRRWPGSSWTSDSSEPSLPADLIIFQGRLSHPALQLEGPFPVRSASFPPASIGGQRCARHAAAGSGRRPPPPARPRERLVQRERRTRILTPTFRVITTDAEKARAGARKGARDGGRGRP